MTIIEKMEAAGRIAACLELGKRISVKKMIQKLNPANTDNGFLLKSENLMDLSNFLHEKIAGHPLTIAYANKTGIELPLFCADDIQNYEKDESLRKLAVLAFFEGLWKEIPKWGNASQSAAELGSKTSDAKKKSSAENGKKGGRPKKVKEDENK